MHYKTISLALLFVLAAPLSAQDFMLQGWYWDYDKDGCNGYSGPSWAARLDADAQRLADAGFTYVWLPPLSRASFGACSNGYDPKDLYDLGEYGGGPTGFGTRAEVDAVIQSLSSRGVASVADVVYNHRDGGLAEDNPAVKAYVETHFNGGGKQPFPSDRFRNRLPLGGAYGAGEYFIKISSKTTGYPGNEYKFYATVDSRNAPYQGAVNESEPNGGGDCGQPNDDVLLDQDMIATLADWSGCFTDEFKLTLTAADFDAAGDNLLIFLNNTAGGYSDHRIYDIFYIPAGNPTGGFNIPLADLRYDTYTDFTQLPSGRGGMNFENFRPNSANTSTTFMAGDFDSPIFFYDVVQSETSTATTYADWNEWLFDSIGIRGLRVDAIKHFPASFMAQMLDSLHVDGYDPGMVVGEFFDSDPTLLRNWVDQVDAAVTQSTSLVRIFDFSLRNALKEACDNGFYDLRNVFNASLYDNGMSGFNVVTFANNHDFRKPGEPLQNDPMLAYAYLLTNNQLGVPTVFYPDYFGTSIPNAPTVDLSAEIDQLIDIHQTHIFGSPQVDYLNRFGTPYAANYQIGSPDEGLIFQVIGGGAAGAGQVVVAINFGQNTLKVDQQINNSTLPPGTVFADLTGNAFVPSATLTAGNRLLLDVPARSYAVYVAIQSLPLELADFTAGRRPGSGVVDVTWRVEAAEDVDFYELEVAARDGAFRPLRRFAEPTLKTTRYVDDRAWLSDRRLYRLRATHFDGSTWISPVRSVRYSRLRAMPNPVAGAVIISGLEQSSPYRVFSADGRAVDVPSRWTGDGLRLELAGVPAGVYVLRAGGESLRVVKR